LDEGMGSENMTVEVEKKEKSISDDLLKQKYLDVLNRFVLREYSFMEEKMIHNFTNSSEY
jgi:hypothetical protein